jgi:hypothetical protein
LSLTALTACGRQEDVETEGEITAATEEQAVVVEEPAAPEPRELTVAPTEENVRLVSRTFEEDGVTWLAQSGSAVECEVTATHAQVQIVGDGTVENEPSLRPRFAVLVDGEVILDDTLSERERTIESVAAELSALPKQEVAQVLGALEDEMIQASVDMDFERAARLRDQIVELRSHLEGTSAGDVIDRLKAGARKGSAHATRRHYRKKH